jgi:hypothetical protein
MKTATKRKLIWLLESLEKNFRTKSITRDKEIFQAGRQWLLSIILATREADIRSMAVQSQPKQIVLKTLS